MSNKLRRFTDVKQVIPFGVLITTSGNATQEYCYPNFEIE